jgi:hypothetical protein
MHHVARLATSAGGQRAAKSPRPARTLPTARATPRAPCRSACRSSRRSGYWLAWRTPTVAPMRRAQTGHRRQHPAHRQAPVDRRCPRRRRVHDAVRAAHAAGRGGAAAPPPAGCLAAHAHRRLRTARRSDDPLVRIGAGTRAAARGQLRGLTRWLATTGGSNRRCRACIA